MPDKDNRSLSGRESSNFFCFSKQSSGQASPFNTLSTGFCSASVQTSPVSSQKRQPQDLKWWAWWEKDTPISATWQCFLAAKETSILRVTSEELNPRTSNGQIWKGVVFSLVVFSMDHPTVHRLPSESSELNLTPRRPDEEQARLRNIERPFKPNHVRAPSRILSDRFIPSRTGSNFALFHLRPERPEDTDYSRRIRRALFPPPTPENGSDLINPPNGNIFRYQTVSQRTLHSVSLAESYDDNAEVNHSAVNAPRKIPKSPCKVYRWFNLVICV